LDIGSRLPLRQSTSVAAAAPTARAIPIRRMKYRAEILLTVVTLMLHQVHQAHNWPSSNSYKPPPRDSICEADTKEFVAKAEASTTYSAKWQPINAAVNNGVGGFWSSARVSSMEEHPQHLKIYFKRAMWIKSISFEPLPGKSFSTPEKFDIQGIWEPDYDYSGMAISPDLNLAKVDKSVPGSVGKRRKYEFEERKLNGIEIIVYKTNGKPVLFKPYVTIGRLEICFDFD